MFCQQQRMAGASLQHHNFSQQGCCIYSIALSVWCSGQAAHPLVLIPTNDVPGNHVLRTMRAPSNMHVG